MDDEPSILAYLAELLTSWGHSVLPMCGCSIAEANSILRDATEFAFDVAIMDTTLPEIDGLQLLKLVNQVSPATVLISADTGPCIGTSVELMKNGLWVQPLTYPFEKQELQDLLDGALSTRHANALVHLLSLPKEEFQLEEVNLPAELVKNVTGSSVLVDVLREEQPCTRRVEPNDVPLLIDPEGNYWNDFRPFRVLFTDDRSRVWRFRKTWLPGLRPPTENYLNCEQSPLKRTVFREPLSFPTDWDLWEINIPWEAAHLAKGRQVEVEVHSSKDHPPKVFWRDSSGSVWRIPNDWRKRHIQLPESDILVLQGVPVSVARAFGGQIVSVNYHPGSRCCLPDCYRFRDERGRRWPVRIEDCVLLSMGEHNETMN